MLLTELSESGRILNATEKLQNMEGVSRVDEEFRNIANQG